MIKLKRAYEVWNKDDGCRVLVDRLWPRGISKEKAHLDLWLKDIAPSTDLRKWFSHDPAKWEEFKKRYFKELKTKEDLIKVLKIEESVDSLGCKLWIFQLCCPVSCPKL